MVSDRQLIRLYLDADVHTDLAQALRLRGYDAVSAWEVGNATLTDFQQLMFAAESGRALFTFNVADFVVLGAAWQAAGRQHAGIILSPQVSLTLALQRVSRLLNRMSAADLLSQIVWLPA